MHLRLEQLQLAGTKGANKLLKFLLANNGGANGQAWARRRETVLTGGVVMSVRMTSSCSLWHEEEGGRSTCGKSACRSCIWKPTLSAKAR
jgi:hypothetical protein